MVLTKNIKEYCRDRKTAIKAEVEKLGKKPTLAVIQVGDNEASLRYIRNKQKDCEEVGIIFEWYYFEEDITTEEIVEEITDLAPYVDGLIVQIPLPPHIDETAIKLAIPPEKDVDGFHPMSKFQPCTPKGIVDYLKACRFSFTGLNAVIFGRSDIVGKPLAKMLTDLDMTVTLCHSKSKNVWHHISAADLIVVAVGKEKFFNCYAVKCPVIDVGINFDENGKLVGDCYNAEGRDVSPVPGGVGLLTRVALLENAVLATKIGRVPHCRVNDGQCNMTCEYFDGKCTF